LLHKGHAMGVPAGKAVAMAPTKLVANTPIISFACPPTQCQVSTQNEGCSSLSFHAFPVRWFAVTALAAIRRFCSMTQVRDLATGDAAIRPSPCADVDLSIVLEQLVHALFRHEAMTPCAFHTALLCRLRSPKDRGGTSRARLHVQPLANGSPLRKLQSTPRRCPPCGALAARGAWIGLSGVGAVSLCVSRSRL
jgi:hypothetical protein